MEIKKWIVQNAGIRIRKTLYSATSAVISWKSNARNAEKRIHPAANFAINAAMTSPYPALPKKCETYHNLLSTHRQSLNLYP